VVSSHLKANTPLAFSELEVRVMSKSLTPTFETWADAYKELRRLLLDADEVCPRGQKTKEILGAHFAIENPLSRLGYHPLRKYSLAFAMAEALLLFQSDDSVKFPAFFNKNIAQFSDDGKRLHGSYGYRISRDLQHIVDKLNDDTDSRQAVLNIYQSSDMTCGTKDVPCTIALHFMVRNNMLDLHVYMRSNDIIWGTMYDIVAFTVLQEVIANTLGMSIGTYYHSASSLHVYDRHFGLLEAMETLKPISFSVPQTIDDMPQCVSAYKKLVSAVSVGAYRRVNIPEDASPFMDVFAAAAHKKFQDIFFMPTFTIYPWMEDFLR
jgi:thymidylate synthase